MTEYLSESLFHFVGRSNPLDHDKNYELLKRILLSGCISHPPHDDTWGTTAYTLSLDKPLKFEQLLVPTVTCFCDIPFESLQLHTSKYGAFGIALSRHHLTKFGARPVTYVPLRSDDRYGPHSSGRVLKRLEIAYRSLREHFVGDAPSPATRIRKLDAKPDTPQSAAEYLDSTLALHVLAFIKPFDSELAPSDPNYFYAEREWRKFGKMKFSREDVTTVVVHPSFVVQAQAELAHFRDRIRSAPGIE